MKGTIMKGYFGKRDLYLWLKEHGYIKEAKWLHKTKIRKSTSSSLSLYVFDFITWEKTPQKDEFWHKVFREVMKS